MALLLLRSIYCSVLEGDSRLLSAFVVDLLAAPLSANHLASLDSLLVSSGLTVACDWLAAISDEVAHPAMCLH